MTLKIMVSFNVPNVSVFLILRPKCAVTYLFNIIQLRWNAFTVLLNMTLCCILNVMLLHILLVTNIFVTFALLCSIVYQDFSIIQPNIKMNVKDLLVKNVEKCWLTGFLSLFINALILEKNLMLADFVTEHFHKFV